MAFLWRRISIVLLPLALILGTARPTAGQERSAAAPTRLSALSIEDALRGADRTSEAMAIARSQVDVADAQRMRATVDALPRVAAYSSYDRLVRSEFQGITLPASEGDEMPELPFGNRNTYRAGLQLSHTVFGGGRNLANRRIAANASHAADLDLQSVRAAVILDVAEAYFDAVLAEQLVSISEAGQAQTESMASRARALFEAGTGSEFDYLRAKVARDRHRPDVLRQRAARDVAVLRLRQLAGISTADAIVLTTPLDPDSAGAFIADATRFANASTRSPRRLTIEAAKARLEESHHRVASARSSRFPTLTAVSTYEGVSYAGQRLPTTRDFRANWTVGGRIDLPLLTGRHMSDEAEAHAGVARSRAELRRIEQISVFDAEAAATQLAVAEASRAASDEIVREATRAHEIALLRYSEGLAIQLELDDARHTLEAAHAERARASRNLLVERIRVALLPALPAGRAIARQ